MINSDQTPLSLPPNCPSQPQFRRFTARVPPIQHVGTPIQHVGSKIEPVGAPIQHDGSTIQPVGSTIQQVRSPIQPVRETSQPLGSTSQHVGTTSQPLGMPVQQHGSPSRALGACRQQVRRRGEVHGRGCKPAESPTQAPEPAIQAPERSTRLVKPRYLAFDSLSRELDPSRRADDANSLD